MQLLLGFNPSYIRNRLLVLTLCLSLISIITEYVVEVLLIASPDGFLAHALNLFSVNLEESIPTWYSTILLFVGAILFSLIAIAKYREQDQFRWHWGGLALGFFYLSADEGAGFHEIFVDSMKQTFNPGGFFAFGWQIIAIPVVVVILLLYVRFLLQLPSFTRLWLIISAIFYLGGALVIEGISANQWDINNGISMTYLAIATIEELFEMLGAVLLIYTVLDYINQKAYIYEIRTISPTQKTYDTSRTVSQPVALLIVLNIILITGMMTIIPASAIPLEIEETIDVPFYYHVQDMILADGGVVIEMQGTFGIDNPYSRQLSSTLLDEYAEVIVVSQPMQNMTTMIATHEVQLSRDHITDLLHSVGQTNFILFETQTVRSISLLQ